MKAERNDMSEINKELFAKVRDHILAEPRRYAQETFGRHADDSPCKTAACLFGWADFLANGTSLAEVQSYFIAGESLIVARVASALGLTLEEARIVSDGTARRWPEPFCTEFECANDDREAQAQAAANYINHIIATGKVT
jgi:hypothetical protein